MTALIGADILKLVRRRGLMIAAVAIVIGLPLIVITVVAIGRAAAPEAFGDYGGGEGYEAISGILEFALFVTVTMLGAVAGSMDESRGVFRDLVATGVSRTRLALSRVPAVVAIVVPLALVSFVMAVAVGSLAGGAEPMPGVGGILRDALTVVVAIVVFAALAVGLSELTGELNISLTVLFTVFLIIQPLVTSLSLLGDSRRFLLSAALTAIARPEARIEGEEVFGLSVAGGLVVLAVWVAAFAGAGVWRVTRREV